MTYLNWVFWIVLYALLWKIHWNGFWNSVGFIVIAFSLRAVVVFMSKRLRSHSYQNETLATLLEPIRKRNKLPALAAATFTKDGIIDVAVTGVRKAGTSVAATTRDLWHLGSNTKAMTALLTGTFVAEKALEWDAKVISFFPEITQRIPEGNRAITVAELLQHRAGIRENLPHELANDLTGPVVNQRLAAAERLLESPAQRPGKYRYSNGGYVIVGAILERLGKKSWEELMRERVFIPLGMDSAGFGGTGTAGQIDQPWPHLRNGEPAPSNGPAMDNLPYMGPAGTVHCSMADWVKFLADQLRGSGGQSALLPGSIYQAMHEPPPGGSYAFGWMVASRRWAGGAMLSHGGSNTMNSSACWLAPAKGFGILVCMNKPDRAGNRAANEVAEAALEFDHFTNPIGLKQ